LDLRIDFSENSITRVLEQHLTLEGGNLTVWGGLSVADVVEGTSSSVSGGWVYSAATGLAVHPDSHPAFADEFAAMFHVSNSLRAFSLGVLFRTLGNIIALGINYFLDIFVPFTAPAECLGPIIQDDPGESCENDPPPCADKLAELCEALDGIPGVSTAFKKCMKGRCGCGGSSFSRARISCDDQNSCGPENAEAGGYNEGGPRIWYCNPLPGDCPCFDTVFHEMAHSCGIAHSFEYYNEPSCSIPGEQACVIGQWFRSQQDGCVPIH